MNLKFRAFHKGVMYYSDHGASYPGFLHLYNGQWEITIIYENGDHGECIDVKESEVMMFTGKEDKNGKEIFKKDIMKIESYNFVRPFSHNPVYKRDKPEISIDLAIWDQEKSKFCLKKWPFGDMTDYEIIGNIYQDKEIYKNPELLK